MSGDTRIGELVEEILESERSVEDVCANDPHLLEEVRLRLKKIRALEVQLDSLFPNSQVQNESPPKSFSEERFGLPTIRDHEIQAELGRGGMGVVYRAKHLKLNRIVALKMLLAGPHAGRQAYLRFMKEPESAATLRHPNIVQIYEFGEVDGQPYFTMEYIEGGTLAEKLAGEVQSVRESAKMIATMARAAFAAHQNGIIHRDLKPANILVAENDMLKISDFGIARRIDGDGGLTQTGILLGTPNYMAPEQFSGKANAVGPATDIFALGAILFEMLVGRPPFVGRSFSEAERRLLKDDPVPPSRLNAKVPRDLETICLKCLEKNPTQRYATAAELADDLDRFNRHEPIRARAITPAERAMRWVRRNPLQSALAVTAIILFGVIVGNTIQERRLAAQRRAEKTRLYDRYESGIELVQEERFGEAMAILGKLGDGGNDDLRKRIDQTLADLKLVEELDAVGIGRSLVTRGVDDSRRLRQLAARKYAALFAQSGFRGTRDNRETVANRISQSDIKGVLVAALDDWAVCEPDEERRNGLLDVARRTDPDSDEWSDQSRNPAIWNDREALLQLASSVTKDEMSIHLLRAVGDRLTLAGLDSIAYFKQMQQKHTDSFIANFSVANALRLKDPVESVRFYQASLAIRPAAAPAANNLAVALTECGRADEAVDLFRHALKLDPESSRIHYNLGLALKSIGRVQEAIGEFQQVNELEPEFADGFGMLGRTLYEDQRYSEAKPVLRKYLESLSLEDAERALIVEMIAVCGQSSPIKP